VAVAERTITVDGAGGPVELSILEAGEGGRPLLMVHGFTGAKEDFADYTERLAELGWHVVMPDQRGHGASAKPDDEGAYSFDIFATDLLALMDALGWTSAVVLGHSMGGMVAQVLTLRAPERVQALILMDTSHQPLRGLEEAMVRAGGALAIASGMEALRQAQGAGPLDNPIHQHLVDTRPGYGEFGDRKLLAASPHMYASMLLTITGFGGETDPDRLEDLRSIGVPTLVIVGEADAPFRKASARMAEAIPGAELAVLPGGAHSPQFEAPDAWWTALSGFLARV
jgi:3-oxoadipate enol-lactonase